MSNILLLGKTGFIGSHLYPRLVEKGYSVTPLLRFGSRNVEGGIQGDLLNEESIDHAVAAVKPEIVVHLAALTPQRESWKYPSLFAATNFIGTVNLVNSCVKFLGSNFRFLAASSAEVYGDNGYTIKREDQPLRDQCSPYAVSKAAADGYVKLMQETVGFEGVRLRCNNTFGRPRSGYFVESMLEKILENKTVDLYHPNHVRDYMWVDDHVSAYLTVLERGYGVYNVSPMEPITNLGMVKLMAKTLGCQPQIVPTVPPPARPADHKSLILDSTLIRALGWRPETNRVDAIGKLRAMY